MTAAEDRARVLRNRAVGVPYSRIAEAMSISTAEAHALGREALTELAQVLEGADAAAALEIEKLDGLEAHAQSVLRRAVERSDSVMMLRAVDRLLLIGERRAATAAAGRDGPVEVATVAQLAPLPQDVRNSAPAMAALLLARRLDNGLPAADLTGVARELRLTLEALAALAPAEAEHSVRDDLRARREQRLLAAGDD